MKLEDIGREVFGRLRSKPPWTSAVGLGRSLIATATLLTLLTNSPLSLFQWVTNGAGEIHCVGYAANVSIFCLLPQSEWTLAVAFCCLVLAVTASGWRPRLTALPHWWVSYSVYASCVVGDGGDQCAAVITLLLVPALLTDPRCWHWSNLEVKQKVNIFEATVAFYTLVGVQIQVAAIYFDAFFEKMKVSEWIDGTQMYYVFGSHQFGPPHYLAWLLHTLVAGPAVVPLTWCVLIVEFLLAINIFMVAPLRRVIFFAGILLHLGIAVTMGITSFAIIMIGALVIGICPVGTDIASFALGSRARVVSDAFGAS